MALDDNPRSAHGESKLHKAAEVLEKFDFAEAPIPESIDPALDSRNQHRHPHRVHEGHGHGDDHFVYVDADVGPRLDANDVPVHRHAAHHPHPNDYEFASPVVSARSHSRERAAGAQAGAESSAGAAAGTTSMPAPDHTAGAALEPVADSLGDTPPPHADAAADRSSAVLEQGADEKKIVAVDSERSVEFRDAESAEDDEKNGKLLPIAKVKRWCRRHRWILVLFLGLFFTSWWISIIAQKKTRHRWLIPTFLWLFLMIRFITFYVRTRPLLDMANWVYQRTFVPVRDRIPQRLWAPTELLLTLMTVLVATFATPEYPESKRKDRAVSFFGYVVFYFGFFLFSRHKRYIRWHTVAWGIFLQYIIALFVLRTKAGYDFFNWFSFLARKLLSFSSDGAAFLTSQDFVKEGWFIVTTLCSIIFFIAFIHIWYYFGVLQWMLGKLSQGFFWLMQVSGAEAVVCAATPFVGQGESAILIKPFLPHATESEIFQILTSGFSTVSGSVLASYVQMGVDPGALVTSCVMSIPASIAASKLMLPETEESLTASNIVMPEDTTEEAHNVLHAFSNGAWFGLQVALSMFANILCIIALISLIDALLTWFGQFWGIPHLTLEQIMGYIFYPVAFLLGVSRDGDLYKVGKLLGTKIIQNEFVAYRALTQDPEYLSMSVRSRLLVTYGLCGFSNLGSCGLQFGVLTKIAPDRKGTIAQQLLITMLVGCFCTMTSACVAGMVLTDANRFKNAS